MKHKNQIHSFYMEGSSATDLKYLLNPSVPFVWLVNHLPVEQVKWHSSTVPINEKDVIQNIKVRGCRYELLMETCSFLEILPLFAESGMWLLQMNKDVPNTLKNDKFPEIPNYLIENGFYSQFNLPHKGEVSMFSCIDKKWIDNVVANEYIELKLL